MRLRLVAMRFANIAGAFAAFVGLAVVAHLAIADGIEGARRHHRAHPPRQAQTTPSYPEVPALLGAAPQTTPATVPAGAPSPCISREEAYRVISATTEGESIDAINTALDEVARNPAGPPAGVTESPLAFKLRIALGMTANAPPCEGAQLALGDAAQLAQVASTAGPEGATGAVGEPSPLSPVSYTYVPTGTPSGDGGWGYRVGHD